jgi:hypothetical protein
LEIQKNFYQPFLIFDDESEAHIHIHTAEDILLVQNPEMLPSKAI